MAGIRIPYNSDYPIHIMSSQYDIHILNLIEDSLRNLILELNEYKAIRILNELLYYNNQDGLTKADSYSVITNIKNHL